MASDVTLELLDRDEVVTHQCKQDLTMDELMVTAADICHISPVTRGLFAFKQVGEFIIVKNVIVFLEVFSFLFPIVVLIILFLSYPYLFHSLPLTARMNTHPCYLFNVIKVFPPSAPLH